TFDDVSEYDRSKQCGDGTKIMKHARKRPNEPEQFGYNVTKWIQRPLADSSAGAIVCAVVVSRASMDEILQAIKVLAEDCRSRGTAVLEEFLPEDAHVKSNGRVCGLESKVMRECCFVVERDAWLRGEFTLSSLDVLQGFSFFLQMGFTLILATLDGLDVGLLGDVIGEDDCDDDG
ncbi:hypothetical protein Tco_0638530, partial [Tanacetum coccineum]